MPAGEYVTFNVTDSYGESATKNIKIIINAVNDAPMLDMADDWVYNNDNASSTDGITIDCTQNLWVDLNITANDIDSSILTFTIDN